MKIDKMEDKASRERERQASAKITVSVPYPPYPKQRAAIFNDDQFSYIEGSTKSGKSSFSRFWIIMQALQTKGQTAFVSPVFAQAKDMFTHACNVVLQFPRGAYVINKSDLSIKFTQGGSVQFFSGDAPQSLYGYGFTAVVIDEASRVKEETWHSIQSTVSNTHGKVRCIGNVWGRSNWFYKACRLAEAGALPNSSYHILTAQDVIDAGMQDASYLDQYRLTMSKEMFDEIFFCIAAGNSANPFGSENIRNCIGKMSTSPVFCWGIDVANTKDGGDATVLIGLDRQGAVCKIITIREELPEILKLIKEEVRTSTLMMMDTTSIGKSCMDMLQADQRSGRKNWIGYTYTAKSKPILMDTLRAGIVDNAITIPEGSLLLSELEDFEYTFSNGRVTYSSPSGLHDDHVNALALAYKCYVDNAYRLHQKQPNIAEVGQDYGIGNIW